MTHADPIGVFDSGLGGLAVAAAIRRFLPNEPIVYFADSANFPYGPRPATDLIRLSEAATRLLLSYRAKIIVVACNTASSAALAALRARFPAIPFIGIVPAVKPASAVTRTHKVGVLATEGTVQGDMLDHLVEQFAGGVEVQRVAAPELAELVEHGDPSSAEGEALVRRFVEPLLAHDIDVLVLGCTHFAFLRPQVERLAGPDVVVLETAEAIARQAQHVLAEHDLLAPRGRSTFRCLTSGDRERFRTSLEHLRAVAPEMLPDLEDVEAVRPFALEAR